MGYPRGLGGMFPAPGGGGGGGVDGPVCGIGVFIAGLWDSARVGYVGVRRDRGCLG